MLSVNTATKYIHLTGLRSLIEEIDEPGSGTVSVPLGEPVTITVSKVQDKYAFLSTADGQESYMGVSLTFFDMRSLSFLSHQMVVLSFILGLKKRITPHGSYINSLLARV